MPNIEEALRRIAHAKATHATTLDLSGLELEELPEALRELTWLEELRVDAGADEKEWRQGARTLKHLPDWMGELNQLQVLKIRHQLITSFLALAQLTALQVLDLSSNCFNTLSELAHLRQLYSLNLSGNQFSTLPELAQLTQLQVLDLSGNQFSTLPELAQLTQLQLLNLDLNQFSTLSELAHLTQLQTLSLGGNQFRQLHELEHLRQLHTLIIAYNRFTYFPEEIQKLVHLKSLTVSGNQLTELPELDNLVQLQVLGLSFNKLTVLPNISNLTHLEQLYISNNNLTILPEWLSLLPNLQLLSASNIGLTNLPDFSIFPSLERLIISENTISNLSSLYTLAYLKDIFLADNPLNIPNEMIPSIGDEYQDEIRQRTLAFLRQLWQGSRTLNEAKVILVGQGDVGKTSLVNRLIADTFDPNEAKTDGIVIKQWQIQPHDAPIQLNLWDFGGQEIMHATHQFFLTKRSVYLLVLDARQDERANRVEYWLKIIASVASDAPVIIVGNQSDQHPLDLDERGLKLKYPQIKAIIATSCKTGAGIQQVRQQIEQEIGAMKHVHDLVPLKWWDVKGEIEQWQSDFISHDRFEEICVKHGIADEFVQAVLLRLLNDLGTVLSYNDDPRLADTNVLKPEWVTNGVYTLLNHKPLLERKHGILNIKDVPKILNDSKRYPAHRCHYITEMMEKFELCFHLEGEHDRVLIPDLLPKDAPDTGDWDDALHFRYRYPILPTSIMSRFIVRSQQSIEGDLRWRTGVVLRSNEGNRAQIVSDVEAAQIDIRITGADAGRRRFLSAIRYTFEQIHNSMSGIKSEVKEYVPLPDHPDRLVDYAELLGLEEMGEDRYVDGVLRKRFDLQQLLDGYESSKERRANRIKGDYENQDVEHLRDLVDIKRDALRVLEDQRAQFGELHVPHHVVTQIETLTNEIGYIEEVMRKRR